MSSDAVYTPEEAPPVEIGQWRVSAGGRLAQVIVRDPDDERWMLEDARTGETFAWGDKDLAMRWRLIEPEAEASAA